MQIKMKKIGTIWATENTVNRTSIQEFIVERLELLTENGPVIIKKQSVEYHVYGKNKKQYIDLMETIKIGLHKGNKHYEV